MSKAVIKLDGLYLFLNTINRLYKPAKEKKMLTVRYIFNEGKATEAAAFLLSLNGNRLPYLKLIKLLYIADRYSLSEYHASITTSSYYSLKYGPVTSEILDLIKHPEDFSENGAWNSTIERQNYDVVLKKDYVPYYLSKSERAILAEIDYKYKNNGQFTLSEYSHTFPEWKDPGDSRIPITIEDILQATISDDTERREAMDDIVLSAYLQNMNYRNSQR